MKLIKLLMPLTLLLFVACDDDHEHIEQKTKEEMIKEFIHHVEEGHFEVEKYQETVTVGNNPTINKEDFVYTLDFSGVTAGTDGSKTATVSFTFTDEPHERTIFTDTPSPMLIDVSKPAGSDAELELEETVDVTKFGATIVKQMKEYHLSPNTVYTIELSNVTTEKVKLFVAPRGIEGEHHHD